MTSTVNISATQMNKPVLREGAKGDEFLLVVSHILRLVH